MQQHGAADRVLFVPSAIVELTQTSVLPPPKARVIRATVTLTVNGVSVEEAKELDVKVMVPALAVPTTVLLFRHEDFRLLDATSEVLHPILGGAVTRLSPGGVLLVVPANSMVQSVQHLQDVGRKLQDVVERLTVLPRFAAFLLGLHNLMACLTLPSARFVSADQIFNLNDIKMLKLKEEWNGVPYTDVANDVEWEDEISSLLVIGPPPALARRRGRSVKPRPGRPGLEPVALRGRSVRFFNRRACLPRRNSLRDEGEMDVDVGPEMCVLVRRLKLVSDQQGAQDASIPAGRIRVPVQWTEGFDNIISSLKFDWHWSQLTLEPVHRSGPRRATPRGTESHARRRKQSIHGSRKPAGKRK